MRKVVINLVVTLIVVLVIAGIIFAVTFLPGEAIRKFFLNNWVGFIGGIIVSHFVMLARAGKSCKKKDEDEDDD